MNNKNNIKLLKKTNSNENGQIRTRPKIITNPNLRSTMPIQNNNNNLIKNQNKEELNGYTKMINKGNSVGRYNFFERYISCKNELFNLYNKKYCITTLIFKLSILII